MPVEIEYKPETQTVISTYLPPFDTMKDTSKTSEFLLKLLAETTDDVHFIADMSRIEVSFGQLAEGMALAYRNPKSPYANPRLKTYTVTGHALIELGAKAAAKQDNYGNAAVKLYKSVEAALKDIARVDA